MNTSKKPALAILGGTGDLGTGLARRVQAGYKVIIGSRTLEKAEAAAKVDICYEFERCKRISSRSYDKFEGCKCCRHCNSVHKSSRRLA